MKKKENSILRWQDVNSRTGLSRSTVFRLERDGKFPQRVRIGLRGVGWIASEIDDFITNRERVTLGREV